VRGAGGWTSAGPRKRRTGREKLAPRSAAGGTCRCAHVRGEHPSQVGAAERDNGDAKVQATCLAGRRSRSALASPRPGAASHYTSDVCFVGAGAAILHHGGPGPQLVTPACCARTTPNRGSLATTVDHEANLAPPSLRVGGTLGGARAYDTPKPATGVTIMPFYEYRCASNGRTVEVRHRMDECLSTWGELVERAGVEVGGTSPQAPVERLMSAPVPITGASGGDPGFAGCGTGCACVPRG
jgi:hypothetical protein